MELYTSLTQLKMAMNGGQMPPMTPIPLDVQKYIDPAFTIGMGALMEDEAMGLRCPVRGCGSWVHPLAWHLNRHHGGIGGATAVRRMLDIPKSIGLVSRRLRARLVASAARNNRSGLRTDSVRTTSQDAAERRRLSVSMSRRSVAIRNLRDTCDAQLSHKIIDLEHRLGHSPSINEATVAHGKGFVQAAVRAFGSWNSAKLQCGLEVHTRGHTANGIYDLLGEYWRVNGRLPSSRDAQDPTRTPAIPSRRTVLKSLNLESWDLAMQQVAFVLGVEHHRAPSAAETKRAQTHCKRGHELSGANLTTSAGHRACRACFNDRRRAKKLRAA